jgi:hypothetical protein
MKATVQGGAFLWPLFLKAAPACSKEAWPDRTSQLSDAVNEHAHYACYAYGDNVEPDYTDEGNFQYASHI